MHETNTAVVKQGNEVSDLFQIESRVTQGCVKSPFVWFTFIDFALKSTTNAMGSHGIKRESKNIPVLDYADDMSALN